MLTDLVPSRLVPVTQFRTNDGQKHLFQNSVEGRVNKSVPDTDEKRLSSFQVIKVVFGTPGISDFTNGRPVNAFQSVGGLILFPSFLVSRVRRKN